MSKHNSFRRTAIVVALSAVFPVAAAYADEVDELTNPNVGEAAVKLPYMNKVNPLYRQYNGVNHEGISPSVDLDVVRRSEDGGWFKLRTENLGLSTQEFGVSYEQQGDWAIGLDYNQIPRYSPYEITTAVSGIGSNAIRQPSYANGAFSGGVLRTSPQSTTTLQTERDITTLTASKFLMEGLKLGFSFKNEDKTGTRMDGVRGVQGTGTPNRYSGFLFSPEPIDQRHQQIEGSLEYFSSKFQLSIGYYGSFLNAKNDQLNVYGGTNTATFVVTPALSPIALAPDNSMQQFYVNGAYNFSADTRGNLKFSRSEGKQTSPFISGQATIAGIGSDLDGKVLTTEMFASLTSRVTRDLKLLGSWRYENKEDKTPIRNFYSASLTPNNPESHKAYWGKAEADYNIGSGFGLTGGFDYSHKSSQEWERREVQELVSRLALRKSMSETINGTVSIAHSEREGSSWNEGGVATPPIYPVYLADRKRDKIRGMVDWMAIENLNLQFAYEAYFDDYSKSTYGLDSGNGQVLSFDGSYVLSDNWKFNTWYSKQIGESKQNMQGAVCTTSNNSNCTVNTLRTGTLVQWDAKLKSNSDQFGVGIDGKIKAATVGAQYLYSRDVNEQEIGGIPARTFTTVLTTAGGTPLPVASGMGVLPDTKYTQNTFKLFGMYPVSKSTRLRLDYIYDLRKMDDYTWTNWVYADGTRVNVKPNQTTQILGISLIQSF